VNLWAKHLDELEVKSFPFNLTNINKDVLEEIYVVINVTNTSTTMAVIPLPTPLSIQSYSIWQGSNQWESQVPSEIILLENLVS